VLIRDILKLQSGTQSGTGVSTPETPKKLSIFCAGEKNDGFWQ
jgi:hypothetical protein